LLAQAELLNRRFVIARRGKPKAALVSVKDLARLEPWSGLAPRPLPPVSRQSRLSSGPACYGRSAMT
jgi:hypothetical protein